MTFTLADLTARTGRDVLSHLEKEMTIPVVDALQAQGDLLVIPIACLTLGAPDVTWRDVVAIAPGAHWREVPGSGIDVLRAAAGGNPHTLVADPGTCRWTTGVRDPRVSPSARSARPRSPTSSIRSTAAAASHQACT